MRISDSTIEPYFIDTEEKQYILKKAIIAKNKITGGFYDSEEALGWYISLNAVVRAVIRLKTENNDSIVTLAEYVKEYKAMQHEIMKALEDIYGKNI